MEKKILKVITPNWKLAENNVMRGRRDYHILHECSSPFIVTR